MLQDKFVRRGEHGGRDGVDDHGVRELGRVGASRESEARREEEGGRGRGVLGFEGEGRRGLVGEGEPADGLHGVGRPTDGLHAPCPHCSEVAGGMEVGCWASRPTGPSGPGEWRGFSLPFFNVYFYCILVSFCFFVSYFFSVLF